MSETTNNTPSIVMLPEAEWQSIKSLLAQVKDTLKAKEQAEIDSQWLESTEARKLLGVSSRTFQSMRDRRVIPFAQFGRRIFLKRADIEAFMEKHYIKARN